MARAREFFEARRLDHRPFLAGELAKRRAVPESQRVVQSVSAVGGIHRCARSRSDSNSSDVEFLGRKGETVPSCGRLDPATELLAKSRHRHTRRRTVHAVTDHILRDAIPRQSRPPGDGEHRGQPPQLDGQRDSTTIVTDDLHVTEQTQSHPPPVDRRTSPNYMHTSSEH